MVRKKSQEKTGSLHSSLRMIPGRQQGVVGTDNSTASEEQVTKAKESLPVFPIKLTQLFFILTLNLIHVKKKCQTSLTQSLWWHFKHILVVTIIRRKINLELFLSKWAIIKTGRPLFWWNTQKLVSYGFPSYERETI